MVNLHGICIWGCLTYFGAFGVLDYTYFYFYRRTLLFFIDYGTFLFIFGTYFLVNVIYSN